MTATLREKLEFVAGRTLGALPASAQARLLRDPPVVVDGQELDPGMQLLLGIRRMGGVETMVARDAMASADLARAALRREAQVHAGRGTPVFGVRDLRIANGLDARHYAPPAEPDTRDRPPALLVFFHGGGWVVGDLDTHDEPCRLICRHAGVHVLSVAYRLAPEHPFPAGIDDALASVRWAAEHAASLGADPTRLVVAGDSAGGNLAAVTAQRARDEGGPPLAAQLLIYPATDMVERRPSRDLFHSGFFLTEEDMKWCELAYLGKAPDYADPRVSPLRAARLDGLPPAIVITAAFDPLRDEGEAYARALARAGSPVTMRRVAGLIHGFMNMTLVSRTALDATLEAAGALRGVLGATC